LHTQRRGTNACVESVLGPCDGRTCRRRREWILDGDDADRPFGGPDRHHVHESKTQGLRRNEPRARALRAFTWDVGGAAGPRNGSASWLLVDGNGDTEVVDDASAVRLDDVEERLRRIWPRL
jgi:hypothetical protein